MLAALPKSAHPGVKKALAEIWGAEDKLHAEAAGKMTTCASCRPPRRSQGRRGRAGSGRTRWRALVASAWPDPISFVDFVGVLAAGGGCACMEALVADGTLAA